jgi:ArsR family transcriptional regulator, arsenate/arsenite/antimonite-responsive transcriptional repressor
MDETLAVKSLAALAQDTRLRIFRALVVQGPQGLTPGQLSESLGVAGTALSFHLKELSHAGLVSQERTGRYLIYRAEFGAMNDLLQFLTAHCCQGAPCELTEGETVAAGCTQR